MNSKSHWDTLTAKLNMNGVCKLYKDERLISGAPRVNNNIMDKYILFGEILLSKRNY